MYHALFRAFAFIASRHSARRGHTVKPICDNTFYSEYRLQLHVLSSEELYGTAIGKVL